MSLPRLIIRPDTAKKGISEHEDNLKTDPWKYPNQTKKRVGEVKNKNKNIKQNPKQTKPIESKSCRTISICQLV